MKTGSAFIVSFIVIIVMAVVAGGVLFLHLNTSPRGIDKGPVSITVPQGSSVAHIAKELERQGLIHSAPLLTLYSRIRGTQHLLKAGEYVISPASSMMQIHQQLIIGKQKLIRVTIPEGWTSRAVAYLLEEKGICSAEAFLSCITNKDLLEQRPIAAASAEGYLFPDTYYFQLHYPVEKVVDVLLDRFFEVLTSIDPSWKEIDIQTLHNRVILASIVEEEYRVSQEAPLIASVFLNRLAINMRLQSCATVGYVLTEILGRPHPERIWDKDLRINSAYNTYTNYGLPPGPIANPGLTALKAVWYPAETDYLYFVLKDAEAGKHQFSRTHSQHVSAKNLFLKGN